MKEQVRRYTLPGTPIVKGCRLQSEQLNQSASRAFFRYDQLKRTCHDFRIGRNPRICFNGVSRARGWNIKDFGVEVSTILTKPELKVFDEAHVIMTEVTCAWPLRTWFHYLVQSGLNMKLLTIFFGESRRKRLSEIYPMVS